MGIDRYGKNVDPGDDDEFEDAGDLARRWVDDLSSSPRSADDSRIIETIKRKMDFGHHFKGLKSGPQITARCSEDLISRIDALCNNKRFPYWTRADYVREAIWYFTEAMIDLIETGDDGLISAMSLASMLAHQEDRAQYQEALHKTTSGLRDTLVFHIRASAKNPGERHSAMIELRRFYIDARGLIPERSQSFLTVIKEMPAARLVAWWSRDWVDNILPDEYVPVVAPQYTIAQLQGDVGIPQLPSDDPWDGAPVGAGVKVKARRETGLEGFGDVE